MYRNRNIHAKGFEKIVIIVAFLIGIIIFQSCTDLETDEDSLLTPAEFLNTEQSLLSFIAPAYTLLREAVTNSSLLAVQEVSTDEICVPIRGSEWNDGGHWIRLHRHKWLPTDPVIEHTWQFLYSGINECNRLLFVLNDLEISNIEQYTAELRAIRAQYYLWLLDIYGNIPIITDYDIDQSSLTNTPRSEVFDFIEIELLNIADQLPKVVNSAFYGRIHFYVVKMMLAKLYINAEVYSGISKWEETIRICDDIINSGNYRLQDDYFDNFITENSISDEIIFAIPFDSQVDGLFNIHMMTLHTVNQKSYNLAGQPWNGWCTVEDFFNSFDNEDLRKGHGSFPGSFIYGPQFSLEGDSLFDENAEPEDPNGPFVVLTPHINKLENALRQDGARIGKFEIEPGSRSGLNNDFPIYRYSDVLLMKAESLWRINREQEALVLTNQIRSRADLPDFESLTAEILLEERGRELFIEMHRRTDLIRFNKFGDPWWEKGESELCNILFPIPQIFNLGPNIQQNECY